MGLELRRFFFLFWLIYTYVHTAMDIIGTFIKGDNYNSTLLLGSISILCKRCVLMMHENVLLMSSTYFYL